MHQNRKKEEEDAEYRKRNIKRYRKSNKEKVTLQDQWV